MGLDTKASDWQVCGILSFAGGVILGAGHMGFDFYSPTAQLTARVTFAGVGIGGGGNASGSALGDDLGPYTMFSSITAKRPFSVRDLDGAWGRISTFGVGLAVSFGVVYITAAAPWDLSDDGKRAHFLVQNVGGFGTGIGAGGVVILGTWTFKKLVSKKAEQSLSRVASPHRVRHLADFHRDGFAWPPPDSPIALKLNDGNGWSKNAQPSAILFGDDEPNLGARFLGQILGNGVHIHRPILRLVHIPGCQHLLPRIHHGDYRDRVPPTTGADDMRVFSQCHNIAIDGDEFTSGFLGLHWFPSSGSSANRAHYERDVIDGLTRLVKTYTGWCVINEIFYQKGRKMTIYPYHPSPELGVFNAGASPTDLAAATMKNTIARDRTGKLPGPNEQRIVGTGTGSDTIIEFSPSVFAGLPGAPTGPGSSADEILLHEMVHGLRQMMGRSAKESVAGSPGMNNYEEFSAIVISNVYRSEKGLAQFRKDHMGFLPLEPALSTTAGFKSAFSQYLTYMGMEQPRLVGNLSKAGFGFNPFLL